MTALASSDVTVTLSPRDKDIGHGALVKNISIASVAFGDGALTYPTGGVPLPAIGRFGFLREVKFCAIEQPYGNGFVYKYDGVNNKLKIFTLGVTTGSTGTTISTVSGATPTIENSGSVAGDPQLAGATIDTTYDFGPMIELPATIAPAAVTVKMLMVGE